MDLSRQTLKNSPWIKILSGSSCNVKAGNDSGGKTGGGRLGGVGGGGLQGNKEFDHIQVSTM